jgi:hypothetical protein
VIGVGYEFVEKRFGAPLQKIIDDAREAEIVKLRSDTAASKERTAEAELEIARLNLEIEKLKAPRILSTEQLAAFIAELKPLASQPTPFSNPLNRVDVFALLSHGEVNRLRDQIVSALRQAGWDARANKNHRVSASHIVEGIVVEVYPGTSEATRGKADALVKALTEAGLQTVGPVTSYNLAGDARIEILIGNKP